MATPEGKVKSKISDFLTAIGAWFFMPVSRGYGRKGIPDFIACVPVTITPAMVGLRVGLFVAIEAKAAGCTIKDVKDWQIKELADIHTASGCDVVAIGANAVETIQARLREVGRQ